MTVGITELPPEGMQLGGVALAGDPDRGTKTTEGLSLLFTTAGITVQGPQPQIERLLVWSGLDTAACREKIVLPDGRGAAVMELTSGGQSIRFLLPTETVTAGQAAYLDQALPAWLARYRGVPAPTAPAPSPPSPPAPPSSSSWGAPAEGPGREAAAAGAVVATGAAVAAGSRATDWATRRSAGLEAAFPGSQATDSPPSTLSPPPPVTTASAPPPTPATAPPPPTGAAPPPPSGPGIPVWQTALDPMPEGTAWDNPPLGQAEMAGSESATKKGRGRRRSRSSEAAFTAPPGAPAPPPPPPQAPQAPPPPQPSPMPPTLPPMEPPPPLQQQPLPQPPPPPPHAQYPPPPPAANPIERVSPVTPAPPLPPPPEGVGAFSTQGAAVWRPAIDPLTGEARWDEAYTPTDSYPPVPSPPPTTWRGRRRAKAAAAAAAAASTAAAMAGTLGAPGAAAPDLGTTLDPPRPQPEADAPWPASDPLAALPADWAGGGQPPAGIGDEAGPLEPDHRPASRNNRTVLILSLILVLVIGGIVYILVRPKNTTTTTPPTLTPTSSPSQVAADAALAASINLRLTDLPSGWSTSTATGQVARPPVAPAAAQVRADRLLASCVGVDYATVAGLFGGSVIPGQTDSARSPKFQSPSDANIQMYSATTVMGTAARAQSLTLPFANPNFVNCFGEYQTALVSAAVPGATATVQVVSLVAPAGVKSFGYLTNLTIPNQANQVVGEAFMVGGRIESRLEPTTGGPAVPSDAFNSAYNAIAGRIAAARNN